MFRILAHTQFGLLQLVDLFVYPFQAAVVGRAEILAACGLGDPAESAFVELRIHRHVLASHRGVHRHARLTVTADAYGINADAETAGDLCRCLRVYVAAVVASVRQQDHYFGLGLAVFHAVDGVSQTQTDCRSVFDHAVFDGFEEVDEHRVVGCQRTLRETLAGEDDQTDLVIRTGYHEIRGYLFGGLQAVGL